MIFKQKVSVALEIFTKLSVLAIQRKLQIREIFRLKKEQSPLFDHESKSYNKGLFATSLFWVKILRKWPWKWIRVAIIFTQGYKISPKMKAFTAQFSHSNPQKITFSTEFWPKRALFDLFYKWGKWGTFPYFEFSL